MCCGTVGMKHKITHSLKPLGSRSCKSSRTSRVSKSGHASPQVRQTVAHIPQNHIYYRRITKPVQFHSPSHTSHPDTVHSFFLLTCSQRSQICFCLLPCSRVFFPSTTVFSAAGKAVRLVCSSYCAVFLLKASRPEPDTANNKAGRKCPDQSPNQRNACLK